MARFLRTETNSSNGHSRLMPPVVVNTVTALVSDSVDGGLTPVRDRNPPVHSFLRPPTVVGAAAVFVARPVGVTLVRSTRIPRKAKSSLPQLLPVNPADNFGGPRVRLVKPLDRVPLAMARLSPPAVVAPPPVPKAEYDLRVTLAPQKRGVPKSVLRPPVKQTALAVPSLVSLFPLLGRVPAVHSRLRPPETPVKAPFAPISVNLTYSRRGKPRSKLSPPAWTRSFGEIKTTFAYQSRGKPKSVLHPPVTPTALAVPALVSLFPLTNRVPAVHSRLFNIIGQPAATFYARPVQVELTYSRRGTPMSRLPSVIYDANIFEPIRGYYLPRVNVPPVHSKLAAPAVVTQVAVVVYYGPSTTFAPQRRGVPKSSLHNLVYEARVYDPIQGFLTPPLSRVPAVHSELRPPTVVEAAFVYGGPKVRIVRSRRPPHTVTRLSAPTVVTQPSALYAVSVTLTPSRRPVAKSRLFPPTVVAPVLARPIDVTLAPQRRGKPKSRLLPVPAAFQPVGFLRVHLAYSLRGKPKSRLSPPTVVFPFFARKTEVTLVRIRPVPTKSRLLGVIYPARVYRGIRGTLTPPRATNPHTISRLAPPAVVAYPVVLYPIAVTLAPSRHPAPKSILHPPVPPETFRGIQVHLAPSSRGKPRSFFVATPIAFQAVELSGPEVTLVRIRPPRTMWNLGPMGPPAVVYAPLSVNLTYSRRGAPKSFLPQASLYQPVAKAEYDLKITLAPQRRGKPIYKLRPPAVVRAATPYFRELPVTLAPQKRGQPKSFLRPPTVVQYFVARPTLVTLAPSRFPRPKSRLLGVIYAARVYAPIRVTLAPSRFPTPKSRLLPPAVVETAFIQINPTRWLARITPPRVHSRLRPPAVVGAGVYFRGIQVHLAYSRRGKPKSKLNFTDIAVIVCYGAAVCGFDFAAEVCGTDTAAMVTGTTSAGAAVSGSDSAALTEGASAPGGSVSGDDARREGC